MHLDIIVDRLLREFKVEANVGAPQVSYKETIKGTADVDYKYKKQSGGSGQYGHVKIRVAPNESGKGYEFTNKVVGGAIPKEYIPAVDAGIRGAMQAGILAGYEVVDVKVELYDGSYHEVDSSEMAFKIAGSIAFKEAMKQAQPILMEPIMKVSVTVPDDYTGTVIGDLSSRRGQIQGQEARTGLYRLTLWCRYLKCSVIPVTFARILKVADSMQWNRTAIRKCQRTSQKRSCLRERSSFFESCVIFEKNTCIFI